MCRAICRFHNPETPNLNKRRRENLKTCIYFEISSVDRKVSPKDVPLMDYNYSDLIYIILAHKEPE